MGFNMRTFILYMHKIFYGANNRHLYKNKNIFLYIVCNVMSRLCDLAINLYLNIYSYCGLYPKRLNGNDDIVVSLTSFPKRIEKVWMVIDSIFHQKVQPGKIYLYLSKEEFPCERKDLPKRLLGYEKLGLNICFREYNLMPHKKYFYALQDFSDKCVITIDDDIYYRNDLINNLLELHKKYPHSICANKVCQVSFDENKKFRPYSQWKALFCCHAPSLFNVALGYGGVLYPANIFYKKDIFCTKVLTGLALRADDLWLKVHEILQNIEVVAGGYYCIGPSILGAQKVSLMSTNCSGENDIQWKKLCEYYGIDKSAFEKDV